MNKDMIENDYSMFEVMPLEEVDFGKYGDYSIICDKSISVRYMIIRDIKLILINRKTDIGRILGRLSEEELPLDV